MRVANNTEWLFYHLWKKNPDTNQCCPGLNIAETVMFRWAQPYFWYSTAKDGTLLRKTKEKVVLSQVEEVFLHNMSKCNVVATCLNSQEDSNLKAQEKIEFEYVELSGFRNFLFQKEKPMNLIMQKFIEPKANKNALIKVSWTQQFCIFFRKTNINDLTNPKIPLVNRLTTFEGAEHLSQSDSISTPLLVSDLEHTCLNIVKHIQIVTGGNIHVSKMVLYFKIDERNRLWLLFCTNLKFKDKSHLNTSKVVVKKKNQRPLSPLLTVHKKEGGGSRSVLTNPQYIFEGPYTENNTEVCLRCSSDGLLFDLKVKMLLEYEAKMMHEQHQHDLDASTENFMEKFIRLEEMDSKHNSNVPEPMKKLFPNITDEKYMKMRSNTSFMNTPIKLCENCHVLVSETVLDTEERRSKNIKIKLSDRGSPRNNESPYLYPPSFHETDGFSHHTDQLSNKSPLEGSLSPSRMHSHSSRSSRLMNQMLNKGSESKPQASKFSTYSFQAQSQFAQANVDGPRPKSGFPYIESYREKDPFSSLTIPVKEHYFRATSAFNSPKEAIGSARFKNAANTLSPYAYEMNIISPQLSHRKLSMRPMTSMTSTTSLKKTQTGKKLSEVLMLSPKEKSWTPNGNVKKSGRTNFTTMMSTIRDMKSFLEQNLE